MLDTHHPTDFASRLLGQEVLPSEAEYREYRHRIEDLLARAERRVRLTGFVVVGSCLTSLVLLYVGGSKLLGDFDPWSPKATVWSIAAGIAYWISVTLFFLSLASYYSRFRPRVKEAKDLLKDATILDLQRQLRELRERPEHRDESDAQKSAD
jgi:uncharacterized membrane protein